MRIVANKIVDIVRFFREELTNLYEKEEIETFIAYCFEEYLNLKRADIFLNNNSAISESELLKFNFAVKDLKQNKPIQYILGKADFYGLKFIVNPHVLIPRPETEELVHLIIKERKAPPNPPEGREFQGTSQTENIFGSYSSSLGRLEGAPSFLDIGTGSGCISIALKKNIPSAKLYALDISTEALDVAKQNAVFNNVDVEFVEHDIFSPDFPFQNPDLKFDCIVSNPPYICISEKSQMHKNVLEHEPHLALFAKDSDPLLFYNTIADFALKHLKQSGKLYFEINQSLGIEIKQMLKTKGFKKTLLFKDLNNNNRMVCCTI